MVSLRTSTSSSSAAASARLEEERLARGDKSAPTARISGTYTNTPRWLGLSSSLNGSIAIAFPRGDGGGGSFSSASSSESFQSGLETKSNEGTHRISSASDIKKPSSETVTATLLLDAETDVDSDTADSGDENTMRNSRSGNNIGNGVPKLRSMKSLLSKSVSSTSGHSSRSIGRRRSSSSRSSDGGSMTGPPPFAENGAVSSSPAALGRDSTSSLSTHESNNNASPTVTFRLPSTSDADAIPEHGGRRARQQQKRSRLHAHSQSKSWLESASLVVEMSTDEEDDDDTDLCSDSGENETTIGPQDDGRSTKTLKKNTDKKNKNYDDDEDEDLETLFDSDSEADVSSVARNSYRSTSSSGSKRVMKASHSHAPSGGNVRGLGILTKHGRSLSSAAVRASNRSMRLMSAFSLVDKLFAQEDQLERDVGEQNLHERELFWLNVDPRTANLDHPRASSSSSPGRAAASGGGGGGGNRFRKRFLRQRRGRNDGSAAGGQVAVEGGVAGGRARRRRRSTGNSVTHLTVAQLARLQRNTMDAINSVDEGDEIEGEEGSELESEGLESDDGVGSLLRRNRPQHRRQANSRGGLFRGNSLQSMFRTNTSRMNNTDRYSSDSNRHSRQSSGNLTDSGLFGAPRSLHGQKRSFMQLPGMDALRSIGGSFSSTRNRFFSSRGGSNVDGFDFADNMSVAGKSGGMVEEPVEEEEEHVIEYIFCPVCIEDVDDRDSVKVHGCGHVFCRDCFHVHLKFEIFGGRRHEGMRCPYPGCKTTVDDDLWLQSDAVLGEDRYAMLAAWEAQYKVKHNPTLFGCTTEGCPTVFMWDGDRPSLNDSETSIRRYYGPGCPMHANCSACAADFCLGCKEDPFHHGRACTPSRKANGLGSRAVLARGVAGGSMDDLTRDFLAQNVVQCGNCGNGIDRRNSTTNTVCVCGHQFCMVCGVEEKDGVMECECAQQLFYRRRMAKMVKYKRLKAEKRAALGKKYIPQPMRRAMSQIQNRGQIGGGGRGQVHEQQQQHHQRPTELPHVRRRSTMLRIRARLGLKFHEAAGGHMDDENGTATSGAGNASPMTIGLLLDHMSEKEIDSRLMSPEEEKELETLLSPVKVRRAMREAHFEVLARQELDRARQERRRRRRELRRKRREMEQRVRQRVEQSAVAAAEADTRRDAESGGGDGDFEPQVVVQVQAVAA